MSLCLDQCGLFASSSLCARDRPKSNWGYTRRQKLNNGHQLSSTSPRNTVHLRCVDQPLMLFRVLQFICEGHTKSIHFVAKMWRFWRSEQVLGLYVVGTVLSRVNMEAEGLLMYKTYGNIHFVRRRNMCAITAIWWNIPKVFTEGIRMYWETVGLWSRVQKWTVPATKVRVNRTSFAVLWVAHSLLFSVCAYWCNAAGTWIWLLIFI